MGLAGKVEHDGIRRKGYGLCWGGSEVWDLPTKMKTTLKKNSLCSLNQIRRPAHQTEASFKVAHILTKHKLLFTDGRISKEAMTTVAESFFPDPKNKTEIPSASANVPAGCEHRGAADVCSFCWTAGVGHEKVLLV